MNTRLRHVIIPLFALAVLLLTLGARAAGPLQFAGKLLAGDGSARDNFGYALDADGDTAVAGAVRWNNPDDSNSDYQGAAYVFTRAGGGWTERKQLTLADGMGYEGFGGALALDGDTLAVGAFGVNVPPPNRVLDAGAVFVYTGAGETWSEPVKLMPGDLVENNFFGVAVALSGDTLLVGAPNVENYDNEAAYVYRRDGAGWALEDKFLPPTGAADFGASVALSGDIALVCASGSTAVPTVAAVVSVYKRVGNGWSPAGELTPDTATPFYGCGLAFDGQTAVVVTRGPGEDPVSTGFVFAYDGSAWTQTAALSPGMNADTWLAMADVAGDRLALGSSTSDGPGQAFVYELDGAAWSLVQSLEPPNPTVAKEYGRAVALVGDSVLVGAPIETVQLNEEQGVVYVFAPAPANDYTVRLPVILKPSIAPTPLGTIVYLEQVEGQYDIFTIRPDGTGKRNLTQSPHNEFGPRWSSDRHAIVFTRHRAGPSEIVIVNADGSGERVVPISDHDAGFPSGVTWSPDGTRLAFADYSNDSGKWDVFVVDVDGSNLTNLTAALSQDATSPEWSPDGMRLVFRTETLQTDLLILDLAGGGVTPLTDNPSGEMTPSWSPDGTTILFTVEDGSQMGLHTIAAGGGESQMLVPGALYGRWSADGANLVFSGSGGGIFRAAADGSGVTLVDPSETAGGADW